MRLIPPQYVKPFVKRGKTDRNDAEAISEAASRPAMRLVPVKSRRAARRAHVLSTRELLVAQRTQAINALRGHATEFGVVAAGGVVAWRRSCWRKLAADAAAQAAHEMLALPRPADRADRQADAALDVRLLASTRPTT